MRQAIDPSSSRRPLIIIGAGGHAVSVANVALSIGYDLRHFVDRDKADRQLVGTSIIADLAMLGDLDQYSFAIAIGDNAVRERVQHQLCHERQLDFPPLIHASSVVSSFSSVGMGSVVMPLSVIGPNTHVGAFCIVNTRASIDQDGEMEDYSSLAPGVTTGGNVRVGKRSAVSIGATIKHGVHIGNDTVIGANSYLHSSLGDHIVAYGSPARIIRARLPGEKYLQ